MRNQESTNDQASGIAVISIAGVTPTGRAKRRRAASLFVHFSHPDCDRRLWSFTRSVPGDARAFLRSRGLACEPTIAGTSITAGREFHPALK